MTGPRAPRLVPEFDAHLVEAAVLEAVRPHPHAPEFHTERDTVYGIDGLEAREAAFLALHVRWFERLALERPFRETLAERPPVARGCGRWLVSGARGPRDEAADLLVAAGVPPTLVVRVRPATVAAPEQIRPLLRRELLHVADMLDPEFGYTGTLPPDAAGGPRERVVSENYRVLWNAWVDGRLVEEGRLPVTARRERLADFVRAFPPPGAAADAAFARVFGARRLTHAAIAAFAAGGREGAARPRCRLCGLPAHDFEPAPAALPEPVLAAIGRDFPSWRPADGLCGRCAEVYACVVTAFR